MDEQRAAYVALALTPGIGPTRLHAIMKACHTATGAFSAPFAFLRSIPGMTPAAASAVAAGSAEVGALAVEQSNAWVEACWSSTIPITPSSSAT